MKKIAFTALLILSAILIFAFSGCGANENPNEDAQTGGSGQAEETSGAPETEDVSELKEMFAEKIGYAFFSYADNYFEKLKEGPLSDKETNEYLFKIGVRVSKPYRIEKKNEYWNDDFERTLTYRLSDIDESLKYVFNKTIDYEVLKKDTDFDWAGGNVDFEKGIYVFKEGANKVSRAVRRDYGKAEINEISKNEDGTYKVDFKIYTMYFISDSYVLSAYHKTATISGKDEGYSIIDYKMKPLSLIRENLNNVEDLIFENKEERDSFKKIDCHEGFTTADGRIGAYVYFKEKPDINYKKSMYELLEQVGADPEAFAWKDLTKVCAVVVTPDQLKKIASSNLVDQILLSYGGDHEGGGFIFVLS